MKFGCCHVAWAPLPRGRNNGGGRHEPKFFFYSVSKRNSRGIAGMFGLYSVNGYAPAKGQGFHLYMRGTLKKKSEMEKMFANRGNLAGSCEWVKKWKTVDRQRLNKAKTTNHLRKHKPRVALKKHQFENLRHETATQTAVSSKNEKKKTREREKKEKNQEETWHKPWKRNVTQTLKKECALSLVWGGFFFFLGFLFDIFFSILLRGPSIPSAQE